MLRIATVLLCVLLPAPMAFAAGGTLKNPALPVLWSASVASGGGPLGDVPECSPGFDRFDLTVQLPNGVWNNKPGGVQIAIRWSGHTLGDNLRLYVYQGGNLIAKSDGIIAIAQAVLIPTPADGLYNIYVAYDPDSPNTTVPYEGLAEVEYAPKPHPTRRLLPDLEVRPQQNLSFDPTGIFFDMISPQYPTCYQTEVDEEGARLCLRFDQIFANVGEGRMELRFSVPTGTTPPTAPVFQRIYHSDGTLVRNGRKVSFCMADITIDFWGRKGDGPRTYSAPDCLFPAISDGTSDFFIQGITNGWSDIYDWYLPDQYIEISGVPDGVYLLETIADPDNHLVEASDSKNCGGVFIQLSNTALPVPTVELLGPAPACD